MQIPSVTEIAPHLGSHRYKFCWECVCLCVSVCVCVRSSVSSCCKIFQRCLLISIRFFCSFFLPQYHFEVSFVFFPSFFLALLKLTTLPAIAIACPILWHLPGARCPGFSPEVVFWLLRLKAYIYKKRQTTKRTSTWTQKTKKYKKCFCFYVLQNIFAIKNDTRIARVITFFPLFFS